MDIEKECSLLGNLFQNIVTDLKSSSPVWDEFVTRGTKLHTLLKATSIAVSAFIESLQKIADSATNTKGSTKDIGSALTRICVRQRFVESKLKQFTNTLFEQLIAPIQERLEDWRKIANQLEKDHAKEYKKSMNDIKKRNTDTIRLQKKARKGSKPDIQFQLNSAMHDINERLGLLEETEKSALRNLLVEERTRVCFFSNSLTPVLDSQVAMMNEMAHLHELSKDVATLCRNPKQLPTSTDQLVQDFICNNSNQTPSSPLQDVFHLSNGGFGSSLSGSSPPASPSLSGSRKSSLCSLNSSDSMSSGSLNHNSGSNYHHRYQSFRRANSTSTAGHGSPTSCKSAPAGVPVARLSSVSSHDSGFVSQGAAVAPLVSNFAELNASLASKPPLPLDKNSDSGTDSISPVIRSRPNSTQIDSAVPSSGHNRPLSWKDWSRPGPYDQPPSSPKHNHNAILPSKPQGPPTLSPKPNQLTHHRLSTGDFPEHVRTQPRPPVLRHQSEPRFAHLPDSNPKSPERPPKPASFTFPMPEVSEGLPLPPPPEPDLGEVTPVAEDPLPPPPPSLLSNGDFPQESSDPVSPKEPRLTAPMYRTPNPVLGDFSTMTLGRKNSNHSLQYSSSSGYSSQNTTPACSEDTIASHDTDYGSTNGDEPSSLAQNPQMMYSTMPRSRDHNSGALRRRPASTAGFPPSTTITTQVSSPGTATIRRKPSSKFNSVRRTSNVPKPVQTPTVPTGSVAKLMSTFMPPDEAEIARRRQSSPAANYYNQNNNNNNPPLPNGTDSSYDEQCSNQAAAVRQLSLSFKQGGTGTKQAPNDAYTFLGTMPLSEQE